MNNFTAVPQIMGILNLTEDSFSDGSLYLDGIKACMHAEEMLSQGAQVIDLGAESTRPGAMPVNPEMQLQRILPVLRALKLKHPETSFSIDTQSAAVAKECLAQGASIINDISALRFDDGMAGLLAENEDAKVILMHMQGTPATMQNDPKYEDVLLEIKEFFVQRLDYCHSQGIRKENILLDPGIGFGKSLEHNLLILANLDFFADLSFPLVLGASRKSFINALYPSEPAKRLAGTLAAAAFAIRSKVAYLRVHEVAEHSQFLAVFDAISKRRMA